MSIDFNPNTLMIDSGAFSVWNNGGKVNLKKYISFCFEYLDELDIIVALDVIPGSPGDRLSLTKNNIDEACKEGWKNYKRMIKAGLPKEKVVPVFHQNDDFKWLERYMEYGVPYLGISPANDCSSGLRRLWLDSCMKHICDKDGMPLCKFHGFAVTSIPLMVRYPWYSCDSASWLKFAIYGTVLIPHRKQDGGWDFLNSPQCVFFSSKIGKSAKEKGNHYSFLSKHMRRVLDNYLAIAGSEFGKSKYRKEDLKYKHDAVHENIYERNEDHLVIEEIVVPGVSNSIEWRCHVNKHYYESVEKRLDWPRPFKHGGRRKLL